MKTVTYDRQAAVDYAHQWAYGRNPNYLDFSELGGDCTNFASQCILAGSHGVMNYTPTFGWYYNSANDRAPAWTGVEYLYNFLTANQGLGPFATETSLSGLQPGDMVQLLVEGDRYHHSPIVVAIRQSPFLTLRSILVAAHSYDADYRPLSTYMPRRLRFLHIEGVRVPD